MLESPNLISLTEKSKENTFLLQFNEGQKVFLRENDVRSAEDLKEFLSVPEAKQKWSELIKLYSTQQTKLLAVSVEKGVGEKERSTGTYLSDSADTYHGASTQDVKRADLENVLKTAENKLGEKLPDGADWEIKSKHLTFDRANDYEEKIALSDIPAKQELSDFERERAVIGWLTKITGEMKLAKFGIRSLDELKTRLEIRDETKFVNHLDTALRHFALISDVTDHAHATSDKMMLVGNIKELEKLLTLAFARERIDPDFRLSNWLETRPELLAAKLNENNPTTEKMAA